MSDHAYPAAPDSERALLGAVLHEQDYIHELSGVLLPEDFYGDDNRKVYRAMLDLTGTNHPLDIMAVAQKTRNVQASYISDLTTGVPPKRNLEQHVKNVREKSNLRRILQSLRETQNHILDGDLSVDEAVSKIQQVAFSVEGDLNESTIKSGADVMNETRIEMELQAKCEGLLGYSTGVACIDNATTGIRQGEFWVVGALPGRGKTAFGVQLLAENAGHGVPTLIFSLEMKRTQIGRRMLANKSEVSASKIRTPKWLNASEWSNLSSTMGELMEWPWWVDDVSQLTTRQLEARARLYIRKHGVKLIILDYLMLVDDPNEKETRIKAKRIANTMRRVAKDFDVAVVALSQLSRPRDKDINRRPSMIDLRESGDIEAAAHVVLLLYMPVSDHQKPTGEDEIIIGKNREGMLGSEEVYYDKKKLRFFDRREEEDATKN
jgi:replicative DNA helicase